MQTLWRKDYWLIGGCVLAYCVTVLMVPPYTRLIDPDSTGYIDFDPIRSALYPAFLYLCRAIGLDWVQITWVQLGIFGLALAYLLSALLRAGFPRLLLVLFVIGLAGNVLFSSFHRSILTESIYFSVSAVAVGLWIDYFRSGRLSFLIFAGLALGLLIGFRPAGLGLLPMHALAAWLKRPRNMPVWMIVLAVVLPVAIGAGSERLLYRAVHGATSQSTAHNLAMGIAAMLIRPDMTFTGPHAAALTVLGAQLYEKYEPVHRYLDAAPSLPVRAQLSAAYEGEAQFQAFDHRINEIAKREGASVPVLVTELGKQIVQQNISGYVKLVLVNQFGQWSVAAQHFPPTARLLAEYADANPAISFGGKLSYEYLHPRPSLLGLVVYPAFLFAGAVTFALSIAFFAFLWRPALMNSPEGFYFGSACFMSAMCQCYTFFISFINVWTPRFLMAVIPQIEIVALCLILIIMHRSKLIELRHPN